MDNEAAVATFPVVVMCYSFLYALYLALFADLLDVLACVHVIRDLLMLM
jgi:hypothetical protein